MIWSAPTPSASALKLVKMRWRSTGRTTARMSPALTASRPCRILLIDGKLVVAAPGRHGPVHDSRIRGQVNLSGGPHEFQYLHAAAGANACMVAAWQPPGSAKPEPIPPEAFGSEAIGQYPAIGVKHLHEYSVDIAGEVPLAGSDLPLVRVQFRSVSTRASAARPKIHWDFGDGQTSTLTDPLHIYLLPGLYTVTMKVSGESESLATTNRVPIHRALVFADQNHPPDQLGPYYPGTEEAHTNPTRQRGECLRALAGASG